MSDKDRQSAALQFYVERYGLGPPLLSVQVEASQVILLRQQQTGSIWCIKIDEHGASASGGSESGATSVNYQRAMYGILPNRATQVEVRSHHTGNVSIYSANSVFLIIALLAEDTDLVFKDDHGTIVEQRFVPAWQPQTRPLPLLTRIQRWWRWQWVRFRPSRPRVSYQAQEEHFRPRKRSG